VWHDKDTSLLKGPKRRASPHIFQPLTLNGHIPIQVKILGQDFKQ
jgi:hypothetical protein